MKYAFLCQDITDTVVLAGEFIDKYMTKANGEFVKVYLYLLYHAKEDVTSADIANALNILEAYWLSEGALRERQDEIPMTFMLKELKQEEPEKAQVACAMRNDIADSEDCSLNRSAMRVGDTTTELCCSRRRSLSREGIWGSYGQ